MDFKQLQDFWIAAVCALADIIHLFLDVPYLLVERDSLNFLHQILLGKYSKIYSPNKA